MKLESLEARPLSIPFRFAFEHASATRRSTETLWVLARTDQGVAGVGEGCPRSYVTGESVATAAAFVEASQDELRSTIRSAADLSGYVQAHRAVIDRSPAAWCAVELALLDALGRTEGISMERLLGLPELEGSFRYTAVVGILPFPRFIKVAGAYRALGMRDFKVKLSGALEDDRAALSWLSSSAGSAERIRVDANNLWRSASDAHEYLERLPRDYVAVEEPLSAGDGRIGDLAELATRLGVPVVLDESFLRVEQLSRLSELPERFILNVRVSKMGGLLRSLEAVRAAKALEIPVIVGAQVGETSVLTRAALPVAREAAGRLVALEGAFGDHLLVEDPCDPSLRFGRGGVLDAPAARPGLGVEVELNRARGGPLGRSGPPRKQPRTGTRG